MAGEAGGRSADGARTVPLGGPRASNPRAVAPGEPPSPFSAAATDADDDLEVVPPGEELDPGARIDRYVVESRLGRGGMGVVYAARDPELDRRVAIKLVQVSLGELAHGRGAPRRLRHRVGQHAIRGLPRHPGGR
jgi:hypothetical protein